MAVGNALIDMWEEMKADVLPDVDEDAQEMLEDGDVSSSSAKCPECGEELVFEGGCVICKSCGWSRCG